MNTSRRVILIIALTVIAGQVYVLFTDQTKFGAVLSIISMVLLIFLLRMKSQEAKKEDEKLV